MYSHINICKNDTLIILTDGHTGIRSCFPLFFCFLDGPNNLSKVLFDSSLYVWSKEGLIASHPLLACRLLGASLVRHAVFDLALMVLIYILLIL